MGKKLFRLTDEQERCWQRFWRLHGTRTESAALGLIFCNIDEQTRARLDDRALRAYLAGTLTREAYLAAVHRVERCRGKNGAPEAALVGAP